VAAKAPNPPALLFDKIKDYPPGYRVLATPCCNDKRIALTLGLPLEASGLDLIRNMRDKINEPFKALPPVMVKDGPITENIDNGDKSIFIIPDAPLAALDGGRYIGTGDAIVIKDPDEGWVNVSRRELRFTINQRSPSSLSQANTVTS